MPAEHRHAVEAGADAQALQDLARRARRDPATRQSSSASGRAPVAARSLSTVTTPATPAARGWAATNGGWMASAASASWPVAVGQQRRVVAVAPEGRRHRGELALAAQAGVLADGAGESR